MKVALCFSGHLRTYEQTAESIRKYLIDPLDCDVFIHTWNKIGFMRYDGDTSQKNTKDEMALIKELLHPKKIFIEETGSIKWDGTKYKERSISREDPANVLGMFYKVKKANDLRKEYEKEQGFSYDLVIRARTDLFFSSPIAQYELENPEFLWIPHFDSWGGTNDQFAFSNGPNMDVYSSLYDYIDEYWNEGVVFHPETLLDRHIEKNNLTMGPSEITFKIIRPTNIKP